jgi:hypothetical protein
MSKDSLGMLGQQPGIPNLKKLGGAMNARKYVLAALTITAIYSSAGAQLISEQVGTTLYDLQSIGSTGNRIAIDSLGGIHCTWHMSESVLSQKRVYYNYRSPSGIWLYPQVGTSISPSSLVSCGYPQICITGNNRPAIVFHNPRPDSLFFTIGGENGVGNFDFFGYPPAGPNGFQSLWPHETIDRNENIHVVSTQTNQIGIRPMALYYSRSNDGGSTWTTIQIVDTLLTVSPIVISSPVSGKVAIVYCHPFDTSSFLKNDIFYVESLDGVIWDFAGGKTNVTHYESDSDSIWAFTDLDALYDNNDNLHIIWNAQPLSGNVYSPNSRLLHYCVGAISEITRFGSDSWPVSGCALDQWDWSITKMSLGVDNNNNLFTAYTSWDSTDCSLSGYANGDLYLSYSMDLGQNWTTPVNVTNSQTPDCQPGDCDSDNWSSMAEKVDDFVHLFFVNDKDAGQVITPYEPIPTENPMLYLAYPNPLVGIEENISLPGYIELSQNYPNPFNSTTRIDFHLNRSAAVKLAIYDLKGNLIMVLMDQKKAAGDYSVSWDADVMASGTYFYRIYMDGSYTTKKMILLK